MTLRTPARPIDRKHPCSGGGFGLIESMTTLLVAAILAAACIPSFQALTRRQQEQATSNLLSSFLASARSTAVTFHRRTVVCPWDGDMGCRDDSDWTRGWLMFYDPDGNRSPDQPDDILRTEVPPEASSLTVHSSQWRPRAVFTPGGMAWGSNLTIMICRERQSVRQIIVNMAGRTRSEAAPPDTGCPG